MNQSSTSDHNAARQNSTTDNDVETVIERCICVVDNGTAIVSDVEENQSMYTDDQPENDRDANDTVRALFP